MKAALLLNGRSAKGYRDRAGGYQRFGHNIDTLYGQVGSIATALMPDTLVRPDMLELDSWRDETPETFVRRLHRDGNADNRYQIFGFVQHHEDLFKLDAMVFALRRLCVRLDAYHLGRFRPAKTNLTNRDVLTRQPEYWAVSPVCKLEKTAAGRRASACAKSCSSSIFRLPRPISNTEP